MATSTTSEHSFRRQNLIGNQAQVYVRESLPIIDLNAINDNHVMATSFIEQLSGIDSFAIETTGVTGTRTLTVQFRHSTDNLTWTTWNTADISNLQLITYNSNQRAYFQWLFGRAGSDTTGIISVKALSLGFTYNKAALSNFGAFTDVTMRGDLKKFLAAVIQTSVIQYSGKDRWEVKAYELRQGSKALKNEILIASLTTGGTTEQTSGEGNWPIQCDLLVKRHGNNVGIDQGFNDEFDEMCGILETIFRRDQNSQYRYSFNFKGVDFVQIPLSKLGASRFEIDDLGDVYDEATASIYHRYQLKFIIFATRKLLG